MKQYTFVMDVGYPVYETKGFTTECEALEYGRDLLAHTNANSVAVFDGNKQIADFDCADKL